MVLDSFADHLNSHQFKCLKTISESNFGIVLKEGYIIKIKAKMVNLIKKLLFIRVICIIRIHKMVL